MRRPPGLTSNLIIQRRPIMRTLSSAILLYASLTSLCAAQLSVPPAANVASPKIDAKRAALLLPTDVAARRIVLAAPSESERKAGLATKSAVDAETASKGTAKTALQIGFARTIPPADQQIALPDLAWQPVDGGMQATR